MYLTRCFEKTFENYNFSSFFLKNQKLTDFFENFILYFGYRYAIIYTTIYGIRDDNAMSRNEIMNGISKVIVEKRKFFAIIFAVIMAFSVFSMNWVNVEEDIVQFLPNTAESKICVDVMENEFITYGSCQIVINDISKDKVEKLTEKISEFDNVRSVDFDKKNDYKKNSALLTVSLKSEANSAKSNVTLAKLEAELNRYDAYIYNPDNNDVSAVVADQMKVVLLIVGIVVVAILLITSKSYGEILVLLSTFLVAALINSGTHFLLGTISMISNSVALVLQLALSIDYAVILCHRYREEREKYDKKEAVISALSSSIIAILASSLTTIAGLLAMTFMQFRLGYDLGRVLIKSIVISLITVFVFTPFLLMVFDGLIQKTKHRSFVPKVSFIGKFANISRFVLPIIFTFALVFGCVVSTRSDYAYNQVLSPAKNESQNDYAYRLVTTRFERNTLALLVPEGSYESEKAIAEKIAENRNVTDVVAISTIEAADGYCLGDLINYADFCKIADIGETESKSVFVYYAADKGAHKTLDDLDEYKVSLIDIFTFVHDKCLSLDDVELTDEQIKTINEKYEEVQFAKDQLVSDNYSRIVITADLPTQGKTTYRFIDFVHKTANQYYRSDVLVSGTSMVNYDFYNSFNRDIIIVSIASILLVLLILIFTFRSALLPVLLIAVIQGSIWINFTIPAMQGKMVFFVCYLIVSAIQMGSNIDYAIVLSSRYIEMRKTMEKKEAIINAVNISFPTVLTTGLMMIFAGLFISLRVSEAATAGIGHFVFTGASITLVLVLFVLPQILLLFDKFIIKNREEKAVAGGVFAKNPKKVFAGITALACVAVLLAIPFTNVTALKSQNNVVSDCEQKLDNIKELSKINDKLTKNDKKNTDTKLEFVEKFLTVKIGGDELKNGETTLAEGKSKLESGEKEYSDKLAEYTSGEQEFNSKSAEYDKGYSDYQKGLAEYTTGKKQYDTASKEYQEGLAEYEKGLAEYNAGKKKIEEAQAELDSAKQLVDQLEPGYNLVNEYNTAVKRGNTPWGGFIPWNNQQANALLTQINTFLAGTDLGTMDELIKKYQAAKKEVSAAEIELNNAKTELSAAEKKLKKGEAKLNSAKLELQAGEKKLNDSKGQLDDADKQLTSAKKELDSGKKKLNSAKDQLSSARNELDSGKTELEDAETKINDYKSKFGDYDTEIVDYYDKLDKISNDNQKLSSGIKKLLSNYEISNNVDNKKDNKSILNASKTYYDDLLFTNKENAKAKLPPVVLMVVALVLLLIATVAVLLGEAKKTASLACLLATLCALISIVLQALFNPAVTAFVLVSIFVLILSAVLSKVISTKSNKE